MAKTDKKGKRAGILIPAALMLLICGILSVYPTVYVRAESYEFAESSRELRNPNRGFYQIYNFLIDDESKDYGQHIKEIYANDADTALSLVEINLRSYREGEITEAGLANIEGLFGALAGIDKRLIVRFLYDWNGENEKYEPEDIETILMHMKQLEPVLGKFSDRIFIMQGLFTGNWGEMHGTPYSSVGDMRQLAARLNEVVDPAVFLAVRTPLQWRNITGLRSVSERNIASSRMAKRLGLFNDGMLGSESDFGTYEIRETEEGKGSGRQEELAFQEALCRMVPNGGEVIFDNPYNDFDNAVKDLATMHVTYLNSEYDKSVLDKWKKTIVTEEGCFYGMDGLSYVKRRLGYRLLITAAAFDREVFTDHMTVRITMKNAGFAPIYKEPLKQLCFYDKERAEIRFYAIQGKLCGLAGGNETDKLLDLEADIDLGRLEEGKYEVYFSLIDPDTGRLILLANEQEAQSYGYFIGVAEVNKGNNRP